MRIIEFPYLYKELRAVASGRHQYLNFSGKLTPFFQPDHLNEYPAEIFLGFTSDAVPVLFDFNRKPAVQPLTCLHV